MQKDWLEFKEQKAEVMLKPVDTTYPIEKLNQIANVVLHITKR